MKKFSLFSMVILCISMTLFSQTDTISYNIYQQGGNLGVGIVPNGIRGIYIRTLNPSVRFEDTDELAGDVYAIINNTKGNDVLNFAIYNKTDERAELSFDGMGNVCVMNGYFSVGSHTPYAKLQVSNGDIYIRDINKGIIMKSPDGNCWRGTLDNDGKLIFELMEMCPEGYTTSVNDQNFDMASKMRIFPNPAQDFINVNLISNSDFSPNLTIVDQNGKLYRSMLLTENAATINISELPAGIYYINIQGEDIYSSEKFIKY